MAHWQTFTPCADYRFDSRRLTLHWHELHRGDREPLPENDQVLQAWALFHSGAFEQARDLGLGAGPAGVTVANKATCIYANYLEPRESVRLALFKEVAQRAGAQSEREPHNANAFYLLAYALGRYSQGISVAKALAQGLGKKIKSALHATIALSPEHADAHVLLGAFHAEVIDKVGALIANMTYGARKDVSLASFRQALALYPQSAIALVEYANALAMLEGDTAQAQATALYEQAAALSALDAVQHLDGMLARTELAH